MSPRNAQAVEVSHIYPLPPGGFYFVRLSGEGRDPTKRAGIVHACPCGCGGRSMLWFRGMAPPGKPEWDVSGEWPAVTLAPSIGVRFDGQGRRPPDGGYHWHGYLRAGVFEEC